MPSDGNMPESFEDDFTLVKRSSMGTKPALEAAAHDAAESNLRHDWKRAEVEAIYRTALPELVFRAQTSHRQYFATDRVQTCQLISIKTGGDRKSTRLNSSHT